MVVKARDIFDSKLVSRAPEKKRAPKSRRQRLIGKVSLAPAPKRKLPTAVGSGPDKSLAALFDGAADLGECGKRLRAAQPELGEAEWLALLRKHFGDVNTKWLASPGRKERARIAVGHPTGLEIDFIEEE